MTDTLEFISKKFQIDLSAESPIDIRNINRTIVAQMFAELGFKVGAEIGVAEGIYSKILFDNIPGLKLHCVDIWEKYPGYSEYKQIEQVYIEAQERLKPYNCNIIKKFSIDAAEDFEDNTLDFVFIDGGHDFKNVAIDISSWSKKVRPGGIVFGHDYKYHTSYIQKTPHRYPRLRHAIEVKVVVDAYLYAKQIKPWFVLNSEIPDAILGRDNPCWMFVRQENDLV